jgi:hypothetical protein
MRGYILLYSVAIAACDGAPTVPFERPDAGFVDGGTYIPVPGTCGFDSPAFCDTFEQGPMGTGRSGELDAARWSGARGIPWTPPSLEDGASIGPALLPQCRGDLPRTVLPDRDAVICDPIPTIPTRHLLTAVAAQNYGLSTYRIRQPFDFEGRTGTIKLDVEIRGGWGWPAIVLAEDPSPAPSFDWEERGSGPRNGIEIEWTGGWCGSYTEIRPNIYLFRDHVQTGPFGATDDCSLYAETAADQLNHVEIYLTQRHLEVWASDPSPDGVNFPNFHMLYSGEIDLPFTRGYVSLVGRNHATLKYWAGSAWIGRWDNVGFDGPVIDDTREYSAPDSFVRTEGLWGCQMGDTCEWRGDVWARSPDEDICAAMDCTYPGESRTVGYVVPNADESPIAIEIAGVSLEGVTGARIALAASYPWFEWGGMFPPPTAFNLRHRLNGGPWHDRFVTEEEVAAFGNYFPDVTGGPGGAGLLNQIIEIDPSELREGTNVLELISQGTWTGSYRVGVIGIDLILDTN